MTTQDKKALPPHYIVDLEGSAYDKTDKGEKSNKPYKITLAVPVSVITDVPMERRNPQTFEKEEYTERREVHINEVGIRSYLKRSGRLERALKAQTTPNGSPTFQNLVHVREVHVTNVTPSTPGLALPSDPSNLNKNQLLGLIKMNHWKIDTQFFSTLPALREAIMNYRDDAEGYKTYETRMKRMKGKTLAFDHVSEELDDYYATQKTTTAAADGRGTNAATTAATAAATTAAAAATTAVDDGI